VGEEEGREEAVDKRRELSLLSLPLFMPLWLLLLPLPMIVRACPPTNTTIGSNSSTISSNSSSSSSSSSGRREEEE